ncbi:MAG: 4'-phosphopantetheinyl transferase superfamily protein [Dokdonella sp.]
MRIESTLQPGQVDVWYCWIKDCPAASLEDDFCALLTDEEAERMARYRFDYLRHEYLVTRALCRLTLSRYADVDPRDWRFVVNAYGRPEIAAPASAMRLRFNLSNARSLVACAVSLDEDVGVDVEETDRPGETLSIADRYFTATELAGLRAQPPEHQRRRFFELWTLKESYIKARGMGLSIPLERFSFDIGARVRIDIDPALEDAPERWHFELRPLGERHMMAVCAPRSAANPGSVRYFPCIPSVGMGEVLIRRPRLRIGIDQ